MDEFDGYFDRFEHSAFRLETLPAYGVDEDSNFQTFMSGRPQAERSVRTSAWMATTTLVAKRWSRVHVVDHPLSAYLRYELVAYLASAAVGETLRITDRAKHPDLAQLAEDFWLFHAETEHGYALLMDYSPDGRWLGLEYTDAPEQLNRCRARRDLALDHSTALNAYLAGKVTITG